MIIRAYRIAHKDYLSNAFSGQGSYDRPGRFNPKSSYAVYTAESLSLAMFEIFVHLPYSMHKDTINELYLYLPCSFDEGLVKVFDIKDLPSDWNVYPAPPSTREIGRLWLESGESVILKVPSVVSPVECNYIINPKHPDFSKITIGSPQELKFDERLILSGGTGGIPDSTK